MMVSLRKSLQRLQLPQVLLLLFLLVLLGLGAVPGYITGKWRWEEPPKVTNIKQLKALETTGLSLPGWQVLNHKDLSIGGHKWIHQTIQMNPQTQAILLLHPQQSSKEQPQVEWIDIKGFGRWQTQQYRLGELTLPASPTNEKPIKIEAQFFQGWNQQQTFAVLQWYAWPQGGSPNPSQWFWADQMAQWQGRRLPWVAVSILIPIEPLGDIEKVWPLAQSLAQTVQGSLMAGPLKGS